MSRYHTPALDFAKLELNSKPKKSTPKMPETRSATAQRRRTASSQTPSSSASERRPTASGSTIRASAQQQHPPSGQTRVDEDDEDDEDTDNSDDSNERDDDDEGDDEDANAAQRQAALRNEQLRLRVVELMSIMTIQDLTPTEFDVMLRNPTVNAYPTQTRFASRLYEFLCRLLSNEDWANYFVGQFGRREVITEILNSIERRSVRLLERLKLDLYDRSGADVPATVNEIRNWQNVVLAFLQRYAGELSEAQEAQLFSAMLGMLISIADCDYNMYQSNPATAGGRQNYAGDMHPGNLYRRWSDEGNPRDLFSILSSLPEHARRGSARRLNGLRRGLSLKRDIIWTLMQEYL